MQDLIPYPNINAKDAETQAKQINNYLLQLKEAVEFEFMRISSESLSALNALSENVSNSNATREEQMSQVSGKVTDVSKGVMSAISQTADNIMLEVNITYRPAVRKCPGDTCRQKNLHSFKWRFRVCVTYFPKQSPAKYRQRTCA